MTKTAFVFPGQGAQAVGMGKDSSEQDSKIKSIYDSADKIFAEFHASTTGLSSKSVAEISFNGPETELARTIYTQPAILTLSIALAAKLKEEIAAGKISKPSFVAGHSLGEFAALYMADVLSLEDVIKLVTKRAALMENALPGAMTAIIGMNEEQVNIIIASIKDASVANYNAPDQIVATGTKDAMQKLGEEITAYATANGVSARVIPLNVGGAFHSPLMAEAAAEFAQEIDKADFKNASIPVIQNINAEAVTDATQIKENLKKQMTGSVQWTKTVQKLIDETQGVTEIWEIGPGKVLAGLTKKQNRRFPVTNVSSASDLENALKVVV